MTEPPTHPPRAQAARLPLGREVIAGLIPHAGPMCLLDQVLAWDELRIHCRTGSHLRAGHPLARDGRIGAMHLVEYAAQGMAVHGALLAQTAKASPGLLVAVRDLQLEVERIDDLLGELDILAEQLLANAEGWLYRFRALCGEQLLASGRVAVMIIAS